MDPMFFEVCQRVVESRFVPGFIIDAFLLPVSKTIARVVSQCDRIPWSILETPRCTEEKKQRALQALSAKMTSWRLIADRIHSVRTEQHLMPGGAQHSEMMSRSCSALIHTYTNTILCSVCTQRFCAKGGKSLKRQI